MRNLFIFFALMMFSVQGQAQFVKLYKTKNDYIRNKFEAPMETITLRNYVEQKNRPQHHALYYFWTENNSQRYEIGYETYLVEYNDSLYLNTYLIYSDAGKRFGRGYAKLRDQDNTLYFECLEAGTILPLPTLIYGIVGGGIRDKTVNASAPMIYYRYDAKINKALPLNKESLVNLLKGNDEELLNLYYKEPEQDNVNVISLYAKAFFVRKELKKKEIATQKQE